MKCKACGIKLTKVIVLSHCDQVAYLNKFGMARSWETPDVQESISARCPECDEFVPLKIIEQPFVEQWITAHMEYMEAIQKMEPVNGAIALSELVEEFAEKFDGEDLLDYLGEEENELQYLGRNEEMG